MRWIHCDEFVYSSAPFMLQLIELYAHVDNKIVKIAKSKIRLLLWFLSEDLAALPLFSSDTTIAVKKAIVNALLRK